MRVMFIVDNPKSAGLGHVMRCSSLLSEFVDACCIGYWLSDGCDIRKQSIAMCESVVFEQTVESLALLSIEWLKTKVNHFKPTVIIVDSYQLSDALLLSLCDYAQKNQVITVGLDDGHLKHLTTFTFLINAAVEIQNQDTESDQGRPLYGAEYTIVRQPIIDSKRRRTNVDGHNELFRTRKSLRLIITFGASDIAKLTLPILRALQHFPLLNQYNWTVCVIVGPQCNQQQEIASLCNQQGYECQVEPSNYAELVADADIAITAAGSAIFEFAYCGVPSVIVSVAENQRNAAKMHSNVGWCDWVDAIDINESDLMKVGELIIHRVNTLASAADLYTERSLRAQELIDGKGAYRIVKELQRYAH